MNIVLLAITDVLCVLILMSLWVVCYQVIKQQGRMLLRMDTLEGRLGFLNNALGKDAYPEPAGLDIGTPIEPFRLEDLTGQEVALEDFQGKRVLLINWSPQCGYCINMTAELVHLQPDLEERNIQLVLACHGGIEENRELAEEHELHCTMLLQTKERSIRELKGLGTPTAYLLDEQGQVASPLAVGSEETLDLIREHDKALVRSKRLPGERPLSESRIERNGLKPGTPAPDFELPTVGGETLSLDTYRGQRMLLVFSDPYCGPCETLLPELARLHREMESGDLAVVMISRGEPQENQRKVEEHRVMFPIALQRKWEISKKYGIFATPVAYLIDEEGVIASEVASGPEAILALVRFSVGQENRYERVLR